ncbi:hypothetical protein [Komagataeibacter xylinus]|uniref:hypothetical protein n=1 Tax=Komagataeibacter xylinus TaxID=28448 RepID=UPI00280B3CD8|nr:hypothetical protein [Komagataeibacter xylinus]
MEEIKLGNIAANLTVEEVGSKGPISLDDEAARDQIDVEETRENTRGDIARYLVLGLLTIIFLGGLLLAFHKKRLPDEDVIKFISTVMASIVPIVATVVGFYFGTASGHKKE